MHDVYYNIQLPLHRKPIPLVRAKDRIGEPYLPCDTAKVIAGVETHASDRNTKFAVPDDKSRAAPSTPRRLLISDKFSGIPDQLMFLRNSA